MKHERLQPPAADRKLVDFLPDAQSVQAKSLPWFARGVLYILLAMILIGIAWASLSKIDQVVVAPGSIKTSNSRIVIQPSETATIRAIHVNVGDRVNAGKSIVEFDPTFSTADLDTLRKQRDALKARMDRLASELADQEYAPNSAANSKFEEFEMRTALERRRERKSRLEYFAARLAETRNNITAAQNKAESSSRRVEILQEILNMREQLIERDAGSRLALLQARLELITLEQELIVLEDQRHLLASTQDGITAERTAFDASWSRASSELLTETEREYDRVVSEIVKGERRQELAELRAPVDAIVLERAPISVGSVVEAAKPIVTLISADSKLEAEINIPTKDVGLIEVGDEVRIKLEAFPFQQYGVLDGRLRSIAPSTRVQETANEQPHYVGSVDILELTATQKNAFRDIRPGMVMYAEIVVGQRSVMSYLLYPVVRAFDESIKEPR